MVVAFVLRFHLLDSKPFWFDEAFSVEVSRLDWRNFLHLLWWREANMSLYYLLLRVWLHFGQSPFFIRSLSVVIASVTVPAVYWLGDLLYERRVGMMAAALFAFNAYSVRYAQEARSYALFILLATLSSGFLVAWLMAPSRRNWVAYVATSILAAYAHLYALLLIAAHWLALRIAVPKWESPLSGGVAQHAFQTRGLRRHLRKAWGTIAVGVLPLVIFVAKTGAGPIKWIQRPGVRDLFEFYEHLAGGSTWVLLVCFAVACGTAVVPVAKHRFVPEPDSRAHKWRLADWNAWRCQFLVVWLLFPVALTALLSFARPVFLSRYLIFCLPAFVVLAAAGMDRLRNLWLVAAAATTLLLLGSQGIFWGYTHDFDSERDASGTATDFILDHTQPGDAILFHFAEARVPYEFFRSLRAGVNTASPNFTAALGPEILFPLHGAGLDYRDFTGKPTEAFLRSALPLHPRVWVMLMNNGTTDKPDPTTLMLTRVLPEMLPKMQRWEFARIELRLYSSR